MIKIIFVVVFFTSQFIYAQTDWVKWEGSKISYEIKKESAKESVNSHGLGVKIVSAARSIYKNLFSDLDGDNCPFYPSCSQFFVESVSETNVFKGTLMFVDRFTRDINFFKGSNYYPKSQSGKFFDPASNYCLDYNKINLQLTETNQ